MKKVFLEILQNLEKSTCVGVSLLIKFKKGVILSFAGGL